MLAEAAAEIGDPQVRNRGTLGGSLAHADPAADYPAAMLALDADIHLKGPKGWRAVKAREFFQGLFTVDLRAGRDHRRRAVHAGEGRGLREAAPARVALRDRRRGGGARRAERRHPVGAHRPDRRELARERLTDVERRWPGSNARGRIVDAAARGAGADLEDVNGISTRARSIAARWFRCSPARADGGHRTEVSDMAKVYLISCRDAGVDCDFQARDQAWKRSCNAALSTVPRNTT